MPITVTTTLSGGTVPTVGSLSDLKIPLSNGVFIYETADYFNPTGTPVYSISTNPASGSISIDSATGALSINTDTIATLTGSSVVIQLADGADTGSQGFSLTTYAVTQATAIDQIESDSATLTHRGSLADDHLSGSAEAFFMGVTDETGFTTETATTAAGIQTILDTLALTDDVIIELNWDGEQVVNNLLSWTTGELTVDGASDFGYARPAGRVIIRPASGKSPVLGPDTTSFMQFLGFPWLHIENVEFSSPVKILNNGSFPLGPVVALKSCSWSNVTPDVNLQPDGVRTIHVEDCVFVNAHSCIAGGWNYGRFWNNTSINQRVADFVGNRGQDGGALASWTSHSWVAGNIVSDISDADTGSGLHPDFFQCGAPSDTTIIYSNLVECNNAHLNRPRVAEQSKGIFGNPQTNTVGGEWCVHNNLIAVAAFPGIDLFDGTDAQTKVASSNTVVRCGNGTAAFDSAQWVLASKDPSDGGTASTASGTARFVKNYYYITTASTGNVSGETYTGNVESSPLVVDDGLSNDWKLLFNGNGSWASDADGRDIYDTGETGQPAKTGKALFAQHFEPAAGWAVNAGCSDPWKWPTDWANVPTLTP